MDTDVLLPISILIAGVSFALVVAWRRGGPGHDAALEALVERAVRAEKMVLERDAQIAALERRVADLERELADVRRDLQASYRLITDMTNGKMRAALGTPQSFAVWLARHFSGDELRSLAADAGIDAQNVKGETLDAFAREMVLYAERRAGLGALQAAARRTRPAVEEW